MFIFISVYVHIIRFIRWINALHCISSSCAWCCDVELSWAEPNWVEPKHCVLLYFRNIYHRCVVWWWSHIELELSLVLHSFATLMWFSLIEIGVVGIAVWLTLLSFWCSDFILWSVYWSRYGLCWLVSSGWATQLDGKLFHHFINECLAHPSVL